MSRSRGPSRDMSYEGDVVSRRERGESFSEIARAAGRSKQRAWQVWRRHMADNERWQNDLADINSELESVPDCWVCGCPFTPDHRCTGVQ